MWRKAPLTRNGDARLFKDVATLALRRYGHESLLPRVWKTRDNLTAYDAVYVALGQALDVLLRTCDRRLAAAAGHRARIEAM